MTVGELISLFPAESTIQINVITCSGSLLFIPDPEFYQQNPKAVASVDRLPVASINIEVEESDGKQIVLLVINDTRKPALAAD